MKYLSIVLLLSFTLSHAKNIGVMILNNHETASLIGFKKELELSLSENFNAYKEKYDVKVFTDTSREFELQYNKDGKDMLQEFSKLNALDTLTVINIKRGIHLLSSTVFISDGTNQTRTSLVTYQKNMRNTLPKFITSEVLRVNYEIGVLHEKKYY